MRSPLPFVALLLAACSSQGDTPTAESQPPTAAAAPDAACNLVVAVTGMS